MHNHHNGLFHFCYREFVCEVPQQTLQPWRSEEVEQRLANTDLLKDFHPDFSEFALEYETWSDHLKSHPEKEGLEPVPAAFNITEEASLNDGLPERGSVPFPFHSWVFLILFFEFGFEITKERYVAIYVAKVRFRNENVSIASTVRVSTKQIIPLILFFNHHQISTSAPNVIDCLWIRRSSLDTPPRMCW